MKKLEFPEDFFAYENPDCPDKDIEKAVNRMKNWMKGETYKSNPWFFMAAGNYLIVGLIAEDGQKTIYVARQYYEIPMVSQDTNGINGIPNIPTDTNGSLSVSDSVSESDKKEKCEKKNANEVKRFKAPTVEQAKEYFADKGYMESEAERFVDHFTANGWKVGKSPMKDWKAAARNWMRNVKDWNGGYQQTMAELPDEGDFLR